MDQRSRLLALVAIAAGLIAFLRRPVKHPEAPGSWHPADRQSTRR